MWEAALVIDYFAHVLRAIILSLEKKKRKEKGGLEAPEEWHIQPLRLLLYTCSLCQQCTGEFNLHHF